MAALAQSGGIVLNTLAQALRQIGLRKQVVAQQNRVIKVASLRPAACRTKLVDEGVLGQTERGAAAKSVGEE